MEDENVTNTISNANSWGWLQKEIPFFECPDPAVEEMYYFRWWSFRKHLVQTPKGWVITEFLTPVRHAGMHNTISCAAGFHLVEGRWLHGRKYLDDYTKFWLRGNDGRPQPHFHKFSSWFAAAVCDRLAVTGDQRFTTGLLGDLTADYQVWEKERQTTNGLFWQFDVRDGMEESISGSRTAKNLRPTINSYMFANAQAIASLALLAGDEKLSRTFSDKAAELQRRVQEQLWNPADNFFEVRREAGSFADVREQLGYVPWMFQLPNTDKFSVAWAQLNDPQGFAAPFGLTTAERRHPQFRSHGIGTCEWDGAVWPFATCQTLYALANFLRTFAANSLAPTGGEGQGEEETAPIKSRDYFDAFLTYTRSQQADGKPYIGEYLDETTGNWINGKGGRSRYYNHSTYADLLITGVVGLRPRADEIVEIHPLLPPGTWEWFCLDGVKYHGHMLTVVWDKDGTRYGRGAGLRILADGKEISAAPKLQPIRGNLP